MATKASKATVSAVVVLLCVGVFFKSAELVAFVAIAGASLLFPYIFGKKEVAQKSPTSATSDGAQANR